MTQRGTEIDWPKGSVCSIDIVDAPFYLNPGARAGQKFVLSIKPERTVYEAIATSKT